MTIVLANTADLPGLSELISQRHRLGQDGYDEMWDGVYHVVPVGSLWHGYVQAQLLVAVNALAVPRGLVVSGPVNIGLGENDYRVPDLVVLRERVNVMWVPTAALVGEVVSPGDHTYAKFGFYLARRVEEILVADPVEGSVMLYRRGEHGYDRTDVSALLEVDVSALEDSVTWPGALPFS